MVTRKPCATLDGFAGPPLATVLSLSYLDEDGHIDLNLPKYLCLVDCRCLKNCVKKDLSSFFGLREKEY